MSSSPLRLSLACLVLLAACGDSTASAPDTGRQRPDAAQDAAIDFPATDAARPDAGTPPEDAALPADAATPGPEDASVAGEDAAAPAGEDASAVAGPDASPAGPDAASAGPDAAEPGLDAAQAGPDAAAPGPDAGSSPRPRGQCATDSHCPSGYSCVASAPGGLCNGCMGDCDLSGPYECAYGGCSRTCVTDTDCPAGLRCATTAGLCALISCGTCPSPYVCEGGLCRRPPCPNGVGDCPAGWGCAKGYCDEP